MRTVLLFALVALLLLPSVPVVFAAELPSATSAQIKAALASGKPTIADFGARTCIPCKKMAPILEELSRELKGKANVTFTDVWANPKQAEEYRIQMIPTQVIFDGKGREVNRHMGFIDKADMIKELKKAGMQ